jgi:WD40 repeat protein/serine/threonine protein kinase
MLESPCDDTAETLLPEEGNSDCTIVATIATHGSATSSNEDNRAEDATLVEAPDSPTATGDKQLFDASASEKDRFKLINNFARGGLGKIWLANDGRIRREVAFKELLPKALRSPIAVSRFLEEAQITGQLEHPGIVPIYELGFQANGTPYYAMKLVRGETFEDAIATYHQLPTDAPDRHLVFTRLLRNFIDICNTLAFAHDHNVIHRDLKPHNVMLGQFGETLVLDWGLAKVFNSDTDKDTAATDGTAPDETDPDNANTEQLTQRRKIDVSSNDPSLTTEAIGDEMTVAADLSEHGSHHSSASSQQMSLNESISDSGMTRREVSVNERTTGTETQIGAVLGTPAYMAPEQARGEHDTLDGRSDVYALGAILFRLLTNSTPYGKGSVRQILKRATDCDFKPPREHDGSIDRAMEAICLKAMKNEQDDRYASALDLKADVEAWLADEPVKAYPDPLLKRLRRWVRRYRTVVLSVTAVAVTATVAPFAIETARHIRVTDAVMVRFQNADNALSRDDYLTATSLLDEAAGLLADEPELGELASQVEKKRASVAAVLSDNALAEEKRRREAADAARHVAEVNFERAERERKRADRNFVIASAQRLVAESKAVRLSHPRLSMLLSTEAVEISRRRNEAIVPEALQNLHDVASCFGGTGFSGHDDQVQASTISSDGRWLLTGSKDRTARLWDLTTADPLRDSVKLTGHEGSIDCVALPVGDRWAITAGEDADVVVWDLTATDINDSPIVLKGHELPVTCMAVSTDGKWLATSGIDAVIQLWDLSSDDIDGSVKLLSGHEDTVNQLCFAPSGRQLFSGCEDGSIAVWPVSSDDGINSGSDTPLAPQHELRKHNAGVLRLAISPLGDWLVSGDAQGSVFAWDLQSDAVSKSFPMSGHRRAVSEIGFAADSTTLDSETEVSKLATAGVDGNVIVWQLSNAGPLRIDEFQDHDGPINDLTWNADGTTLVTCGDDRAVILRNLEPTATKADAESSVRRLHAHEDAVTTLSHSKGRLVTGAVDGAVHVWDAGLEEPGMTPVALKSHRRTIREISASPDGQYFLALSSDRDKTWSLWHRDDEVGFAAVDIATDQPIRGDNNFRATAVAWSPTSEMAAIVGSDATLVLLNVSGNEATNITVNLPPIGVNAVCFSSEGSKLAAAGNEGAILVMDVAALTTNSTLQLEMKITGDSDLTTIAANSSGTEFASGSEEGGVIVWNSDASWKLLPGSHRDLVNDIVFSPNGDLLASVSDDKSVRVWKRSTDGTFESSPMVLVQHEARIRTVAFGTDGNSLLTVSDNATAIVWSLDSDMPEKSATLLIGHDSAIHAGQISDDGRWAVTGSDDGTVRLWDLLSKNPSASVVIMHQFDEPVRVITLIDDSQTLVAGLRSGDIFVWPLDPVELMNRVKQSAGRTLSSDEIQQFNTMAAGLNE